MRKIPTLYKRDPKTNLRHVWDAIVDECEWVLDPETEGVVATRKFDGTCCLVRDRVLYRRQEVKPGKPTPAGFELVETDETIGKSVGWVPVGDGPDDQWHREAWEKLADSAFCEPGTYELVGPKIQGNHEGYESHVLVRHGMTRLMDVPSKGFQSFLDLCAYLLAHDFEGIVWYHPDGRMAKLKRRDVPEWVPEWLRTHP